jgi:hypothetical protein
MKKLLFALFIIILFSCEKDNDRTCWDCYIKDNLTEEVYSNELYCDYTLDELKADSTVIQPVLGISYRICYDTKWQ